MWELAGNNGLLEIESAALSLGEDGTERVDVEDNGVETPEVAIAICSCGEHRSRSF